MERFYYNYLEAGMPPAHALKEAQLWLRDATRDDIGEYCTFVWFFQALRTADGFGKAN